jgi:hypothetical protein
MAIRLRPRKAFAAVLAVVAMVTGLALVSAGPASASTYYPITVNTANWSGSAGFGSRPPGLTVDSSGVIHLQGALRQFSAAGSGADWIGCTGSAPLCAWGPPGRTVYTIAHTLGGSYADLAIDSNGSIWLIPSSNTPIPDGFLSLEGISYLGFVHGGGPITQIQLASNWYSYTPQYNYGASSASWWEDSNQTVHFSGGVQELTTTPGWAQLIGWIPTYAAPWQGDVYTIVHTLGGTYADLDITPDGRIFLFPSANTNSGFVSLEGVTFSRLGPPGFHPLGPVSGWTPNTSFGAAVPGWYKDPDGIVHLEGGYSWTGASSDEIATIDPSAAPRVTVYTIVHTGGGTYGSLMITPGGQIWLIWWGGAPKATDRGYVSLDGVTYQQ